MVIMSMKDYLILGHTILNASKMLKQSLYFQFKGALLWEKNEKYWTCKNSKNNLKEWKKGFYEGEVANKIVNYLQSIGGYHELEDFIRQMENLSHQLKLIIEEKQFFNFLLILKE